MLAARRMMLNPFSFLDYVGVLDSGVGGSGWAMSSVTVAYRISGTWTSTGVADNTAVELGVADAYRVTTVVGSNPTGSGNYCYWLAGWGGVGEQGGFAGGSSPNQHGVFFATDNSTSTLYLFHGSSNVQSQSASGSLPVAGDTVELTVDFSTTTASAKLNGTTVATFNFSGQSWYTADGHAA